MKNVITLSSGKKLNRHQFLHYFERKIFRTIRKFNLIDKKDSVAVACSGGKDSMTVLYVLNEFCKQRSQRLEAIAVEEGMGSYRKKLLIELKKFCKNKNIKLNVFSFKKEYGFTLDKIAKKIKKLGLSNCYVCSILKRWLLNKKARELGFSIVATGHSLDDEAETIILNQMKGAPELLAKLGPCSGTSKKKDFVQRIKPLYFCSSKEVILYARLRNLPLSLEVCPARGETFRVEIRNFLKDTEKNHPEIKNAIVNSFLQIMPMLKEKYKNIELKKCKVCKEPSSQEICKRCQILKLLR